MTIQHHGNVQKNNVVQQNNTRGYGSMAVRLLAKYTSMLQYENSRFDHLETNGTLQKFVNLILHASNRNIIEAKIIHFNPLLLNKYQHAAV